MRTVPKYAKNFLFCIKNFWNFLSIIKVFFYICFCIFTISSSCTLNPLSCYCLVYELFALDLSKIHLKHILNIKCQLFIGPMLNYWIFRPHWIIVILKLVQKGKKHEMRCHTLTSNLCGFITNSLTIVELYSFSDLFFRNWCDFFESELQLHLTIMDPRETEIRL